MRIGVPAYCKNDMVGIAPDYLNFVEEFGTPVIIPPFSTLEFVKTLRIEGLVLPGGADVDTRRYSKFPQWLMNLLVYPPDFSLEHFDTKILPFFVGRGFPIFGICRGLQTLNVLFGGTLWPHLPRHPYSQNKEHLSHEITYINAEHTSTKMLVNSFHHQAIMKPGENVEVLAKTSDGVVEAIRHTKLPIFAVQWHPERMGKTADPFSYSTAASLFGD